LDHIKNLLKTEDLWDVPYIRDNEIGSDYSSDEEEEVDQVKLMMRKLMTPKFIGAGLKFFVNNEKAMLGEQKEPAWRAETNLEGEEYGEEDLEWCEGVE
jgi:hypothetical protein